MENISKREWELASNRNLYISLVSFSRIGLSRKVKCYIIVNNELINVTYEVANELGLRFDSKRGGVLLHDCGMDMGFWLAATLTQKVGSYFKHQWI